MAPSAFLRWSGLAFALAFLIHGADHARRGLDASPPAVAVIGTLQAVLVALAAWMAWTGYRRAPALAILVGFGSVLLVTFGHLLPATSPQSDSFVTPPATNVTWLSWASALAEVAAGMVLGVAGILVALRPARGRPRENDSSVRNALPRS